MTLSNAANASNDIIAFVLIMKMKFPSVGSALNVKVKYNPSPKFLITNNIQGKIRRQKFWKLANLKIQLEKKLDEAELQKEKLEMESKQI
jgi:hypothetical protein